jgi:hypothetical protein
MDKKYYYIIGGVLIILIGYKLLNMNKLTQREKDVLFSKAFVQWGIQPPPEIAKKREEESKAALEKIKKYGLESEYDSYRKQNSFIQPN